MKLRSRFLTFLLFLLAFCAFGIFAYANARETYPGQYAQQDPVRTEWFNKLRNKKNELCCGVSDCHTVEMETTDGKYYVRTPEGSRLEVPADRLVAEKYEQTNPTGSAVICYMLWQDENYKNVYTIYCFVRGALI